MISWNSIGTIMVIYLWSIDKSFRMNVFSECGVVPLVPYQAVLGWCESYKWAATVFDSDQMRFCNDILWFDIWQKDSLTFYKLTISFRFNSSNEKNNLNLAH